MSQPGTSFQTQTVGAAYAKAVELLNAGRLDEAHTVCMSIIAVRPKQADVHNLLAAIAYKKKDGDAAIKHFQHAVKADPGRAESRLNLAKTYRDFGHWSEAARTFEHLVKQTPGDSSLQYELGKVYGQLGRYADAVACCRKAMDTTAAPDVVETELANNLMRHGAIAEAEAHYNAILTRTPGFVPALVNLAVLRDEQGRLDDSLAALETALAGDAQSVDAHFHHALGLIARERLAEGWAEYVWRFRRPNVTTLHNRFPMPYWAGESLEGRTLLVWTEQGLGDEILLTSMLPDILARGAHCKLVCTTRLVPLFQRSFPEIAIFTRDAVKQNPDIVGAADYQASLSQLGLYLRPSMESFPRRTAYLAADAGETQKLRERYRQGSTDRLVGIAWHSANPNAGTEKSVPLATWEQILRVPGYRFVSLQYGDHQPAYKALRAAAGLELVVDKSVDAKKDMDKFAAQVAAMDLVISVSNTTVHVAAGLGIPVWTLLPAATGRIWYWFLDRTNSPWYPTMRLFRQQRGAGWGPILAAVAEDLRQWT